jgi:hypothetical protein
MVKRFVKLTHPQQAIFARPAVATVPCSSPAGTELEDNSSYLAQALATAGVIEYGLNHGPTCVSFRLRSLLIFTSSYSYPARAAGEPGRSKTFGQAIKIVTASDAGPSPPLTRIRSYSEAGADHPPRAAESIVAMVRSGKILPTQAPSRLTRA